MLKIDIAQVETAAKELYVRALKLLPPDIKAGFARLSASETDATAQRVLGTMVSNIAVAERTDNLLCQDTGIPIYNVTIGRGVIGRRCAAEAGDTAWLRARDARASASLVDRASDHARQRAHVVRAWRAGDPLRFRRERRAVDRDDSEGLRLGEQLVSEDGDSGRRRRRDQDVRDRLRAGCRRKNCPPTIVGVGVGGTADLCVHLAKRAAMRPLGSTCSDPGGSEARSRR